MGSFTCAFFIGQSVTPFLVFQMYSQPIPKADTGTLSRIYVNGKELNTFSLYQETGDIVRSNTDRFIYLKQREFKDKYYGKLKEISLGRLIPDVFYRKVLSTKEVSNKAFSNWLKDYLQRYLKAPIKTLSVKTISYRFNETGMPSVKKEEPVFNFSYE